MFGFLSRFFSKKVPHPSSFQVQNRRDAYDAGIEAEIKAETLLKKMGFKILARRFKTNLGEIDLLVANSKLLIAVEVKKRKTLDEGKLALRPRQCRRIANALKIGLAQNPSWERENIRFDLIAFNNEGTFCHVPNIIHEYEI
ncbi:DUF91 domain-containing protein [Acetobacteraceae bacterium]|nr:DUF91 domain-containing protein [Acetobacteraceae bacterium]